MKNLVRVVLGVHGGTSNAGMAPFLKCHLESGLQLHLGGKNNAIKVKGNQKNLIVIKHKILRMQEYI